jgi:hypothetical protein
MVVYTVAAVVVVRKTSPGLAVNIMGLVAMVLKVLL